jgi:hypothetical protein
VEKHQPQANNRIKNGNKTTQRTSEFNGEKLIYKTFKNILKLKQLL